MNFKHLKILLLTPLLFVVLALPTFVLAVDPPCSEDGKICNPLAGKGINNFEDFIPVILEGVMKIAIPVIALAIIYSGFLFVTAQGNSEKLSSAKAALFNSLIGATILLGAWAIAKLISKTVLSL